jgi:hypothetical protein
MSRGEIGASWLRSQFIKLSEVAQCFAFATWSALSKRPDGQTSTSELLFQMRLLWIQWSKQQNLPRAAPIACQDNSGLPAIVEIYLKNAAANYVDDRGIQRFHRDILLRLRRREIGMQWFKGKLVSENECNPENKPFSTEDQWDSFLKDDEGANNVVERLFQMHLVLANYYRSKTQMNAEVI